MVASYLLSSLNSRKTTVCTPSTLAYGLARVGSETEQIVSGTLAELKEVDFGGPLHSLIVCSELHHMEQEMFDHFRYRGGGENAAAEAAAAE